MPRKIVVLAALALLFPAGLRLRAQAAPAWDEKLRATADRTFGNARLQFGGDVDGRHGLESTDTVVSYNACLSHSAENLAHLVG